MAVGVIMLIHSNDRSPYILVGYADRLSALQANDPDARRKLQPETIEAIFDTVGATSHAYISEDLIDSVCCAFDRTNESPYPLADRMVVINFLREYRGRTVSLGYLHDPADFMTERVLN